MKKLPLSKFDLGMIIAFVVIGLLGGGAWYYLSGQLQDATDNATAAKKQFDTFSSYKGASQSILVTKGNEKILQNNIDMLKGQLDPLIAKLKSKENKLYSIEKKDPVAWKHNLDDKVRELTAAAGVHSVKLPPNYYFTFSNYLNQNPADDQTEVLSKQLLAIEQLTDIMINAPVRSILDIQRTFEEDSKSAPMPGSSPAPGAGRLGGSSYMSEAGAYRVYPFAIEFETSSNGFRKVMDDLIKSPYIFVVRTVSVVNEQTTSPVPGDLDKWAGSNDITPTTSDPGTVGATVSTKSPMYLFGNATLHVKVRVDLIEWLAPAPDKDDTTSPAK
jgi:hypothetical protein